MNIEEQEVKKPKKIKKHRTTTHYMKNQKWVDVTKLTSQLEHGLGNDKVSKLLNSLLIEHSFKKWGVWVGGEQEFDDARIAELTKQLEFEASKS